jgi:hypothetical protein
MHIRLIVSIIFLTVVKVSESFYGKFLVNKNLSYRQRQRLVIVEDTTSFVISDLPVFYAGVAVLGIGAGYLQYSLFAGKQGLGAYLSDGKGFQKSNYKPLSAAEEMQIRKRGKSWFKLPKLDFVEVFDDDDNEDERNKSEDIVEGVLLSPPPLQPLEEEDSDFVGNETSTKESQSWKK